MCRTHLSSVLRVTQVNYILNKLPYTNTSDINARI